MPAPALYTSKSLSIMESQNKPNRRLRARQIFMAGRFSIIWGLCLVIGLAIGVGLVLNTVVHAEAWNNMAASSLSQRSVIEPRRGLILASDGSPLATNLCYYNVRIDLRSPAFKIIEFVDTLPMLADSLAKYFPTRDRDGWERHLRAGISVPKESRSRSWTIAKKITFEEAQAARKLPFFRGWENTAYTGLIIEREIVRSYPFGEVARLSVGRVGETAEDSRIIGRSGLECALDTLLYGVPGVKVRRIGTRGTYMAVDTPAINGYDVTTTIDITVQDILESELGEMLIAANADWGTAMIMEVSTGDIKALSNLERDSTAAEPRYIPALNRIVEGYEPGSVMKVMSMAVAMRYGYANLDQVYPIGKEYRYLINKPIRDTHSPKYLPVRSFMEYSSNIGMVKMSMPQYESNPNLFRERLAEMGFFDRLNTGIARERRPYFPMLNNNREGRINLSRMVFGYSTMIPPLYTCAFYNAIANDGRFVRPRLVKGLRTPAGVDSVIPTSYVRDSILSPEQARELRRQMHDVVWGEGGTAKALRNPIVEIAGKTGTSKIALEKPRGADGRYLDIPGWRGGYLEGHYRVTFCGIFPYEHPRYTCIVVISDPKMPYRGPAVSSGTVLKNVALKMYARGMLDEDPEFHPAPDAANVPLVHTSFDNARNRELHNVLAATHVRTFTAPAEGYPAGQVPDVRGVSLREALTHLEEAGYAVAFEGVGFVDGQTPAPGTTASPGTTVHLSLKNLR